MTASRTTTPDATDPTRLTLVEASALLRRRALSSRELVDACLRRIAECDGPHSRDGSIEAINAFARVYEQDARAAAARADALLTQRGPDHPLLGIPLAVKDIFPVTGKPLTAGSRVLDGAPARCTAPAYAALARAGMVMVGHTHTWDFAFGYPPEVVGNPWDTRRSPAGSSSGSAAALAAGLVPAALGSDTGGSLRGPSSYCGTSTIKPTLGAVSNERVIPCASSFDHVGPMARTLADCALMLPLLTDANEGGASRPLAPRPGHRPLAGVRVVLSPRTHAAETCASAEVLRAVEEVVGLLRALGATLLERETPPFDQRGFWSLVQADALAYHRRMGHWPARRDRYSAKLRELLEAGEREALDAHGYARLSRARRAVAAAWERWFAEERVDVLLEPTTQWTAPLRAIGEQTGETPTGANLTSFWNHVGLPVAALPAGLGAASGLPTGVSFVGPPHSELALLRIGVEVQERLGVPTPPQHDQPTTP